MSIFKIFGIGGQKIISQNQRTVGTVAAVKACWWLKVNTKPVRTHALDGARFPHIIEFTYSVNGRDYSGKRYVSWAVRCPQCGERITVYYDSKNPASYAVDI